jgi:hypothetical protein
MLHELSDFLIREYKKAFQLANVPDPTEYGSKPL